MTSLTDRPNTALLVIDMQKDIVVDAHDVDRVVANINTLVDRARTEKVPVIWIQHADTGLPKDSDGWQYIDELSRNEGEPLVHKHYGDSFADTELEAVLESNGVGRVIVTGAQTDACIRSTLHSGLVRGYDVTLVGDAHTTEDMRQWGSPIAPEQAIAYTNMYWQHSQTAGGRGGTVDAADIDFEANQPVT